MVQRHMWYVTDRMACCFLLLNACLHVLPAAAQLLCSAGCGVQQQHLARELLMGLKFPRRTASQAAVLPACSAALPSAACVAVAACEPRQQKFVLCCWELTLMLHVQVLIQNGELLTGGLCKKTLGTSGGSLIHVIWMEHGAEAARAFLSQAQYLVNYWLLQHGFSIGIGDTVADQGTRTNIDETINKVSCSCSSVAQAVEGCKLLLVLRAWVEVLCGHRGKFLGFLAVLWPPVIFCLGQV